MYNIFFGCNLQNVFSFSELFPHKKIVELKQLLANPQFVISDLTFTGSG